MKNILKQVKKQGMFSHLLQAKQLILMTRENIFFFFFFHVGQHNYPTVWVTGRLSAVFEVSDIDTY